MIQNDESTNGANITILHVYVGYIFQLLQEDEVFQKFHKNIRQNFLIISWKKKLVWLCNINNRATFGSRKAYREDHREPIKNTVAEALGCM